MDFCVVFCGNSTQAFVIKQEHTTHIFLKRRLHLTQRISNSKMLLKSTSSTRYNFVEKKLAVNLSTVTQFVHIIFVTAHCLTGDEFALSL
jgi:hypothetical protein